MDGVDVTITRPDLESIIENFMDKTVQHLDNIADIYKSYLASEAPIGETHELSDLSMWEALGQLERFIFSASGHFDPLVKGHKVFGPIFSDLQRRWWFWYLLNELGGVYMNKTDGQTEPNDYPQDAYDAAESDVDSELQDYLEDLVST